MYKKYILVIIVALVALGGYLLVSGSPSDKPSTNTQEVVTSFYPLFFFTERLTEGTGISVANLAGARDPHDYEPSRADIDMMRSAALVVAQGAELESWLEDIRPTLSDADTALVVMAEHIDLFENEDAHEDEAQDTHNADGSEVMEGSVSEDTHTDDEDEDGHEDEDNHGHDGVDPHTWLDPVLAQNMVREITTALVAQFPEQEATLEENAHVLIADLATLDTTYRARLSSCTVDEAFISHDAAGYLARRYDLSFHAIAGLSTEDEPSAKLLNDLSREAGDKRAILAEQGTVTAYAETLSRETGLAIVPFNPLGRGPLEEGADYFDVMERNLESLAVAFACDTI